MNFLFPCGQLGLTLKDWHEVAFPKGDRNRLSGSGRQGSGTEIQIPLVQGKGSTGSGKRVPLVQGKRVPLVLGSKEEL